jgi:hypothetical protein
MQLVALIVLAVVAAVVAFDAIRSWCRERKGRKPVGDETLVTTQKIIVDLTRRR